MVGSAEEWFVIVGLVILAAFVLLTQGFAFAVIRAQGIRIDRLEARDALPVTPHQPVASVVVPPAPPVSHFILDRGSSGPPSPPPAPSRSAVKPTPPRHHR